MKCGRYVHHKYTHEKKKSQDGMPENFRVILAISIVLSKRNVAYSVSHIFMKFGRHVYPE